jgi:hypothetical protein
MAFGLRQLCHSNQLILQVHYLLLANLPRNYTLGRAYVPAVIAAPFLTTREAFPPGLCYERRVDQSSLEKWPLTLNRTPLLESRQIQSLPDCGPEAG